MDPKMIDICEKAIVNIANNPKANKKFGVNLIVFYGSSNIPHMLVAQDIINEYIGNPEERNKKIHHLIRKASRDPIRAILFGAQIERDRHSCNPDEGTEDNLLILYVDAQKEIAKIYEKNEGVYVFTGITSDDVARNYEFQNLFTSQ